MIIYKRYVYILYGFIRTYFLLLDICSYKKKSAHVYMYVTYVTANKSTNNNVVFFFVSCLKIIYYNNY